MHGLGARLFLGLCAVAVVGLSLSDVAFVLWLQAQQNRERALTLQTATAEAAYRLASGEDAASLLFDLARRYDVVLVARPAAGSAVIAGGPPVATEPLPSTPKASGIAGGFAYARFELDAGAPWREVVALQPLQVAVERVLAYNGYALPILLAVALAMVLTGMLLLRRSVLLPLRHVIDLIHAADSDALARFGAVTPGSFSALSSAIIARNQKSDEDRARLSEQLAALRDAHDELQKKNQELVRAKRLAVIGELAAGLAHELGNPLAIVRGFTDILKDDLPAHQDVLDRIAKELTRMQRTLRQLLDFSRAPQSAAGHGEVNDALTALEALLRPQERLRGRTLNVTKLETATQVPLATDAILQVLVNLVLNAADALATRGPGGTIQVSAELVGAKAAAERCQLVVDDDGPGIAKDLRARVFTPFFTTKPAGQGTGLGLSVCEHIVSACGGDIELQESPRGGARFIVTLPCTPSAKAVVSE